MITVRSLVNKTVEKLDNMVRGTFLAQILQDLQLLGWFRGISYSNFQSNPFFEPKFIVISRDVVRLLK
jgi:hypothetical protein